MTNNIPGDITPERMEQLKTMNAEVDKLQAAFVKARDSWTQACSDLNYAMLEQLDYYQYIRGITKICPAWVREVKGEKPEHKTKRQIDAMVSEMLKKTEDRGEKRKKSFTSLF